MYKIKSVLVMITFLIFIFTIDTKAENTKLLYLDGQSGYVLLPNDIINGLSMGTIEVWVKWQAIHEWSRVFDFGQKGNAAVLQSEKNSSDLNFAIYDKNSKRYRIQKKKAVEVGQWHHLAVVTGPNGMKFYVDGKLVGTEDFFDSFREVGGGANYIGKSNWEGDGFFKGYISEFRLWNRERSEMEIIKDRFAQLSGNESGLLAYWRFQNDPDENGLIHDLSGNGNDANLVGGAHIFEAPGPPISPKELAPKPEPLTAGEEALMGYLKTALSDGTISEEERQVIATMKISLKISNEREAYIRSLIEKKEPSGSKKSEKVQEKVPNRVVTPVSVFERSKIVYGNDEYKSKITLYSNQLVAEGNEKNYNKATLIPYSDITALVYSLLGDDSRIVEVQYKGSNRLILNIDQKEEQKFIKQLVRGSGLKLEFKRRETDGCVVFRPPGNLSKSELIEHYYAGRNLDAIEGIWLIEKSTKEIAIVKNTMNFGSEWEYVGFDLSSADNTFKPYRMLIKTTVSKYEMAADYVTQHLSRGRYRYYSCALSMADQNTVVMEFANQWGAVKLIRTSSEGQYQADSPTPNPTISSKQVIGTGTGFFISPDVVATNYHVIDQASEVVLNIGELAVKAELLIKDEANDLALLRVIGTLEGNGHTILAGNTYLPLGNVAEVMEGAKVYTIGHPLTTELGKRARLSEGIVNSIVGFDDDPRMFQISVPVQPGNSGGPLLNERGEVIGVITSTLDNKYLILKKGTFAQNVNFAVKVVYLNSLLSLVPNSFESGESSDGDSGAMEASDIMALSKSAIVLIEARK